MGSHHNTQPHPAEVVPVVARLLSDQQERQERKRTREEIHMRELEQQASVSQFPRDEERSMSQERSSPGRSDPRRFQEFWEDQVLREQKRVQKLIQVRCVNHGA